MIEQPPVVCPLWKPNERRSHGGRRFNIQPLSCIRCGSRVAAPLAVWMRKWKEPLRVICEPCSTILEQAEENSK